MFIDAVSIGRIYRQIGLGHQHGDTKYDPGLFTLSPMGDLNAAGKIKEAHPAGLFASPGKIRFNLVCEGLTFRYSLNPADS
ncbi:MAG: hypothetical protein A2167_02290 [Planctomycetes bacterium RBG_13_46_10]|nr:MAG: hypothetical protein A2167_02290 [Planctomycetes bacterium RBG_13_46_10]